MIAGFDLDFSSLETLGRLAWRASWQASVLAIAVFAVLAVARRRISPAWRYALWSLVLVRLLLPWAPPARWSPFNLDPAASLALPAPAAASAVAVRPAVQGIDAIPPDPGVATAPLIARAITGEARRPSAPIEPTGAFPNLAEILAHLESLAAPAAFAWMLGVAVMLGITGWRLARLRAAMKGWRDVEDPAVLAMADDCRTRLGLRRAVRIRVAPDETGPAVFGVVRPRVVLPESLLTDFPRDQLEAILLHELAHVRRHDPAVHWLMIAARAIHWFNPVARLALSRMAAERELACDDAVIGVLGGAGRRLYGETILRLVARLVEAPAAPGLVHFFGSKRRLWRRLDSLTRKNRTGRYGRWIALGLLAGLGVLGLTDAVRTAAVGRNEAAPPPAAAKPKTVAMPPKKERMTWPLGAELAGTVVDHKGAPVADAEVVPLGPEKLLLFPVPGRGGPGLQLSWMAQGGARPDSEKTDAQGRFSVRRAGTPANRIAVISQKVLLWVVSREQLGDVKGKDLTIRLPEPGEVTIHCDIPDKPGKQEFWMTLRTFDDVDWEPDTLLYREIITPNPGEQTVKNLAPAQYVIERHNLTPTDKGSSMMTQCDRKLVKVEPAKVAEVSHDRKGGRRVVGVVKGMDGVKLRQATLTVSYWGPEEEPSSRGGRSRMMTHFDCIVIGDDRRFSIPKLPPGEYHFDLGAIKAATPRSDREQYDYTAQARITIPAAGEVPPVEIVAKPNGQAAQARKPDPNVPGLEVHAKDEAGAPVKDFEAELYIPNSTYRNAYGVDGVAIIGESGLKDWAQGELVVTAPGFASTIVPQGAVTKPQTLDVTLKKGKPIRLRVRDSKGKPIPQKTLALPLVFREKFRFEAWQILGRADADSQTNEVKRMNLLGVRPSGDGDFVFHVPPDLAEHLYFGFSHPDVLRYYEKGPLSTREIEAGAWDITLPEPATLEVSLKVRPGKDGQVPFANARYSMLAVNSGKGNSYPSLLHGTLTGPAWRETIPRIAPGPFFVYLHTEPKVGEPRFDMRARPGSFSNRLTIDVKAGQTVPVAFEPPPFNPDAWKGKHSAVLSVVAPADRKPGGDTYKVSYMLAHYGMLTVAEGAMPANGKIPLDGIAASGSSEYGGMYWVEVNGLRLGDFRVKDQSGRQEFAFRTAPQVGDVAPAALGLVPGVQMTWDLTGDALRRGDIVFLEFWATWCGPCQEPMHKLAEIGKRRGDAWGKRGVRIVAMSIDQDRETLNRRIRDEHLDTGVGHLWSPEGEKRRDDHAKGVYAIDGVPTAFLIGRDGRIVWRGHPNEANLEARIDRMLAEEAAGGKR